MEVQRLPLVFMAGLGIFSLLLQSWLPIWFAWTGWLQLPLLVVVYLALTWRRTGAALLAGAALGLAQDSLSHLPLGIFGIANTLSAYIAAWLAIRVDTDHSGMRFLLIAGLCGVNQGVIAGLEKFLLLWPVHIQFLTAIAAMLGNAVLGVLLFKFWDRFRRTY